MVEGVSERIDMPTDRTRLCVGCSTVVIFCCRLTHPNERDSYRDELTPIVGIHGSAMLVVWTLASKSADDPGDHVLRNAPSPSPSSTLCPCAGSSWYVAPYRAVRRLWPRDPRGEYDAGPFTTLPHARRPAYETCAIAMPRHGEFDSDSLATGVKVPTISYMPGSKVANVSASCKNGSGPGSWRMD
jgi:hypothetical protein